MPCGLVNTFRRFRGVFCLRFQSVALHRAFRWGAAASRRRKLSICETSHPVHTSQKAHGISVTKTQPLFAVWGNNRCWWELFETRGIDLRAGGTVLRCWTWWIIPLCLYAFFRIAVWASSQALSLVGAAQGHWSIRVSRAHIYVYSCSAFVSWGFMAFIENLRIYGTCEKKCQYFTYVKSSFILPCWGVQFFVDSLTNFFPSDLPCFLCIEPTPRQFCCYCFSVKLTYTSSWHCKFQISYLFCVAFDHFGVSAQRQGPVWLP